MPTPRGTEDPIFFVITRGDSAAPTSFDVMDTRTQAIVSTWPDRQSAVNDQVARNVVVRG